MKKVKDIYEQNSLSIAFLAIALFTVLVFLRPNELSHDLPVAGIQRTAGIIAIILGLLSLRGNAILLFHHRILGFFLLYLFAMLLSIPFSLWPGGSVTFFNDSVVKEIAILFVLIAAIKNIRSLKIIMSLIAITAFIVGVFTIKRYFSGELLLEGYRASMVQGVFSDPNDLALHLIFAMPFAYFVLYRSLNYKITAAVILITILVAVPLTFSRGGMLGLGACVLAIWYFDKEKRKINTVFIVLAFVCMVTTFPSIFDRLSTLTEYDTNPEESMMNRWQILQEGIRIFFDNPLVGVGLSSFSISEGAAHSGFGHWKEAHNSFVEVAAETGLLGLIGFAGCVMLFFRTISEYPQLEKDMDLVWSGVKASAVGFIVCGLFLSQGYSWYFFYLVGFTVIIHNIAGNSFSMASPMRLGSKLLTTAHGHGAKVHGNVS